MPITVHPSNNALETVATNPEWNPAWSTDFLTKNPFETVRSQFKENGEIFQSSFPTPSKDCSDDDFIMQTDNQNGFVDTALCAYNKHHHLVLRPDDIWIAIIAQFNLFVNANAEQLRHLFVAHEGKKELTVVAAGNRYTPNNGDMAVQMGELIQKNVVDPSLREWIIPGFTTTTESDTIISSVIMMSTLKKYFSFRFTKMCGLPAVTLLGEKEDWDKILDKIEKLKEYGEVTTQWHGLLKPVLTGFVNTFDQPEADSTKDFWQKIADHRSGGSGPSYLSGWITAFCFFDTDGQSLYRPPTERSGQVLIMDGATYHHVDTNDIPPAFAEVPVLLNDNGVEFKTVMIAGLLGMRVSGGNKDTVRPQPAWWIAQEIRTEDDNKDA
ncbi:hypothetical protein EMPS_11351 [Entomortierella parvispora]|uniref:DUF4419 domain-containing protein n=1 Tax=Entomortierella parvispora TaxID=205924 RepID=A0A9P3HN52_9FUNG|nr:hypothetical protein EMPS_11351 [Entomortierella parvispora]